MAESKKKAAPKRARSTRKWIRNLRNIPASLPLESGRRIELKPRGQRGDAAPVTKEDIGDVRFELNDGLLFEVITEEQAKKGILKQTTNQQAVHPALKDLKNKFGDPIEGGVVVPSEDEAKGVTVAYANQGDVNVTRINVPGSADNPMPPDTEQPPKSVDPAAKADEVARRPGLEGPAAGLGGDVKVVVDEVQSN